jgi:translocation and assembly module TamB
LLSAFGVLLTTVILLLVFVLGTQAGLRTLLAIVEDFAPDMIDVARVEGRVLGRLELDGFALRLPGLDASVGALVLDWSPGALFGATLRVSELTASDVVVLTEPAPKDKPPSEPFELPSIKLPIGIDIGQVLIENLTYNQIGSPETAAIKLTRAELAASASGDTVDLKQLSAELSQPDALAKASGQVQLDAAYPVQLSLDWRFRQPPALELKGDGQVTGDLERLLIDHRISGSVDAVLKAQVAQVLKAPSWDADVVLNAVELPELVPDAPSVELHAELKSSGDLDKATLTGTLAGKAPEVAEMGQLDAALDVEWASKVLSINALRLTESQAGVDEADAASTEDADGKPYGGARVDVTGRLDVTTKTPAFTLQAVWEALRWPLAGEPLAESPSGSLHVQGDLDGFDYRLKTGAFGQQIPESELALVGTGDKTQTTIVELTLGSLGGTVNGKGQVTWSPALSWDLAVTGNGIDPGRQWAGLGGTVVLKADSRGGLDDGFSYALNVDAALDAYPAALINLVGTGTAKDATVSTLSIETLGGVVEGEGEAAWSPAATWSFKLDARDIDPGQHYPGLDGSVTLTAETAGGLEDGFAFSLNGDAGLSKYPPAKIDLAGRGTAESAVLESLRVDLLNGHIDGAGKVSWAPALGWDAALTLTGLDPGQLLADWPGSLGGKINSKGATDNGVLALTAMIDELGGTLRGYPVRVAADVAMQGKAIDLKALEASSGDTRLRASGRADDALNFRYEFRSPSLTALLPELKGSLNASGTVAGAMTAPRVTLKLDGRDIEMNGQGVQRITADADVGVAPDGPVQLNLNASNLIAGTQRFDSLTVRGQGSMPRHQVTIDLKGGDLSLDAAAEGSLGDAGAYRGRLNRLNLDANDFGSWRLQKTAAYSIGGGAIDAGPLCLTNGGSSQGCVGFQQPESGRFVASLNLERLGFDLLDALTPDTTAIEGYLTANARFEGSGQQLTGNAKLRVPEGRLQIVLPQASQNLVFTGTQLDVQAGGGGIDGTFQLPVEGAGRIEAKVGLPGFRLGAFDAQPLNGRLRLDLSGLDKFASLAPQVSGVQGRVDGDIALSGTLTKPVVRGTLAARDLALQVATIGLNVSDLNVTAESESASQMRVTGGALVGGGQFDMEGSVAGIGGGEPSVKIKLRGDKLKVADSKEYLAIVSMDMEAGFGAGGGAVRGEVSVPKARISPRTIPAGAVQPSPDVVLEEKAEKPAVPISVDVLAKLGDAVLLEAFGLRGLLRGQLRVTQNPGRPLLGNGELQVVDGSYRVSLPGLGILASVGKPLVIKKGIVLFANSPLDNPGIILNAQREGGDITAGLRVLGTLRNPKLAFFSESDPNMTQSEITTYLVTGVPPRRGGKSDNQSLSLGTYIAPKLFMEYDSSMGDKSDAIKMRYDLTKSIQVQSETGDAQGVDIFYKFEN